MQMQERSSEIVSGDDRSRRDRSVNRKSGGARNQKENAGFVLDDQVGFLLRAASQRNTILFAELMVARITRVQFATLAKLYELGSCSQNELGRLILMDRATIKGVVNRLRRRKYVQVAPDKRDRRQHVLSLTTLGQRITRRAIAVAPEITERMLERMNAVERRQIVALLRKITQEGQRS